MAARPAPTVLSSTSSTDATRPIGNTYCVVSIMIEPRAPSAVMRGSDASARNRIGPNAPTAAKTSRFPSTW